MAAPVGRCGRTTVIVETAMLLTAPRASIATGPAGPPPPGVVDQSGQTSWGGAARNSVGMSPAAATIAIAVRRSNIQGASGFAGIEVPRISD